MRTIRWSTARPNPVYPPGSTMKVVTATAALDSGEFEPSTTLNADSGIDISGVPLANAGGEDFGTIDMSDALTNSVNTYWAQVGEQLGTDTMVEYMGEFGYSDPPLDFPSDALAPSGPINSDGELVREGFDVGRVAIGQGGAEAGTWRPRSRWRWSRRRSPTAAR